MDLKSLLEHLIQQQQIVIENFKLINVEQEKFMAAAKDFDEVIAKFSAVATEFAEAVKEITGAVTDGGLTRAEEASKLASLDSLADGFRETIKKIHEGAKDISST